MRFLPLVWSGIWRKPGRAVLALVQILLAFALFGLLQGWHSGVTSAIAHSTTAATPSATCRAAGTVSSASGAIR